VSNFFNILRNPFPITHDVFFVTRHASRVTPFLSRVTLLFLLIASHSFAQDMKPLPGLPFQQTAPQAGNEEQLAMQFYQNREFDKAAGLFERIYEKKPSIFNYQYLFFCLVEIKEYGKAERLVKKCQRAEPDAPRYQVDLGYINYRSGHPDK
jgi:tetratricopeptide (TPR) repeat protein